MATLSPQSKAKNLRHPPPSLFLGPPSHNASQVSVSNPGSVVSNAPAGALPSTSFSITPQRPPNLQRQRSQLAQTVTHSSLDQIASSSITLENASIEKITANIPPLGLGTGIVGNAVVGTGEKDFGIPHQDVPNPLPSRPNQQFSTRRHRSESQKQADRTDALWAEMQSTLQDVDLSASYNIAGDLGNGGSLGAHSGGMHVFGPDHGKVLEVLRSAQMELAKAWARSEGADDEEERRNEKDNMPSTGGGKAGPMKSVASDTSRSHPALSHAERETSFAGMSTAQSGSGARAGESGRVMEEETKSDILLARKRREANDGYFKRVNEGVLDVVGKLEEVARAMRAVEKESRDIWGEEDSMIDGRASVISADR